MGNHSALPQYISTMTTAGYHRSGIIFTREMAKAISQKFGLTGKISCIQEKLQTWNIEKEQKKKRNGYSKNQTEI